MPTDDPILVKQEAFVNDPQIVSTKSVSQEVEEEEEEDDDDDDDEEEEEEEEEEDEGTDRPSKKSKLEL